MSAAFQRYRSWHHGLSLRRQLAVTGIEITLFNTVACGAGAAVGLYAGFDGMLDLIVLMWFALELYVVSRLLEISIEHGEDDAEEVSEE